MILELNQLYGGGNMIKLLGSLMILGASTGIGFIYSDKFKKRTRQLIELQRCIYQLQNEIVYTHTTLPEAIESMASKSIYPLKQIFEEVSKLLFKNEVDTVYEAFCYVLDQKKGMLNLKPDDVSVLLDLAKTLGESDIEGQKKMFYITLESLKKAIKDSEILMNKNIKMYRYLGFSIGAMTVIILV